LGIVRRRAGLRDGSDGLGASIMTWFPFVDPGVGLARSMGPGQEKGQRGAAGGLRGLQSSAGGRTRRGSGVPSEEQWAGGPRERREGSHGARPSSAPRRITINLVCLSPGVGSSRQATANRSLILAARYATASPNRIMPDRRHIRDAAFP
jgi:hypothetical protein